MRVDTRDTSARHRTGEQMRTKLVSLTLRAKGEPKCKFISLTHLLTEEFLRRNLRCSIFFLLRVRIHSSFNQILMPFKSTTKNKNLFSNQTFMLFQSTTKHENDLIFGANPPLPPFEKGGFRGILPPCSGVNFCLFPKQYPANLEKLF